MGKRLPLSFNKDVFPGPNQYEVKEKHIYDERMARPLSVKQKRKTVKRQKTESPAPGAYNL